MNNHQNHAPCHPNNFIYSKVLLLFLAGFLFLPLQALQLLESKTDNKTIKQQLQPIQPSVPQSTEQLLVKLNKLAKSGDARAQFSLANMYHNGTNVEKNDKLAFYWYSQVAEQGYASAQLNVANAYYYGLGVNKNPEKAAIWYQKSAEQGDLDALYYWALLLLTGDGIEKDNEAALIILFDLSAKDHTLAQYQLSQIYHQGKIVPQNKVIAETYLYEASKAGHAISQYQLAKLYQQKELLPEAIHWLGLSVEQNYQPAKTLLDEIQSNITENRKQSNTKNLLKAVIKPNIMSETPLLSILSPIPKLPEQKPVAIKANIISEKPLLSILKPSEQTPAKTPPLILAPEQAEIAQSLSKNAHSLDKTEQLFINARRGDASAQYNLGVLFATGETVLKDNRRAFLLIQAAAKQGLVEAQNRLAIMYMQGVEVQPSHSSAYFWASTSARSGNQDGKKILLRLLFLNP